MDLQSPPSGFTVRRNPPRRAKQTPLTDALNSPTRSAAAVVAGITRFPLEQLLEHPEIHPVSNPKPSKPKGENSENLKVFLRIRPPRSIALRDSNIAGENARAPARSKAAKDGERRNRLCLLVNSSSSVTLNAPPSALDSKRAKSEVYDGFSHVFPPESLQEDIYGKVMQPLVMDFMEGQSSLLVAMGPTGSGKTYTMFGSPLRPGIVPLTLRQIFSNKTQNENIQASRAYYLSIFEIHSVRGKGEKIYDLSPENIEQSSISNLRKVKISDATDAEKIVNDGILKRSTAPTNANSQSSRSQCVINIHCVLEDDCGNHSSCNSVLTIADLAGAERERKTGNQGTRLLESNFINNTSMVFGLCLRSLLEHQKNPKKPIEKHFKNSLLTRYLQDYMEGKKRMTLILTVKGGQEDYMDTSFVLRQASPYMKINFNHLQEITNAQCQKRNAALVRTERSKRRKIDALETSTIVTVKAVMDAAPPTQISGKELPLGSNKEIVPQVLLNSSDSLQEVFIRKHGLAELHTELSKTKRSEEIMTNVARALWIMLKQYKNKLKESTEEVLCLKERLRKQSSHVTEMKKELKELRNSFTSRCSLVDDCAHSDGLSLIPSSNHDSLDTDALLDENRGCLIPEASGMTEISPKAHTFVTKNSGDQTIIPSSMQQGMLPQLSEVSSHVALDKNSENIERGEQSLVQMGGIDEVVMDPMNIATLTETEGCFSHLPVNEGTEIMVVIKEQSEAKVVLDQFVQNNNSHVTEALKGEEEDRALRPLSSRKPRRKLLPASAMLLKDLGELNMDENSKETNGKTISNANDGKSQGSISLVRILHGSLPR